MAYEPFIRDSLYVDKVMWHIKLTDTFKHWLRAQDLNLKKRVAASLLNLEQYGPVLPRPYADTVKG